MSGFFSTPDRVEKLLLAGSGWIGTPFRKRARIKGGGVDCVNLVIAIYRESGFDIEPQLPAHYSLDGGKHSDRSLVLDFVSSCNRFVQVGWIIAGDLLCFHMGRSVHHVGLSVGNGQFLHALNPYGVMTGQIDDSTYGKRLTHIFRPL